MFLISIKPFWSELAPIVVPCTIAFAPTRGSLLSLSFIIALNSFCPHKFEKQIKALGAEIAGDELWIERVENAVVGKLDLESTLSDDSAFGKLLKDILATPHNPDEISGLMDVIADLRRKIPSAAFGADSVLNLDENQTVERLVDEAKHMLIGRLLVVGGAK